MAAYLARRALGALWALIGVATFVFLILHLTGDPAAVMMPPEASAAEIAAFRHAQGFDRPLIEQFGSFVASAARGDLGLSLRHQEPAMALALERLPATIELAGSAFLIVVLVGVPAGVLSALRPRTWIDYAARYTYDYHYQGTGNWPFNTAYAAHWGLESEVTQLHSLAEAEQFVKAGIPLVASLAFQPNKLDGFLFRGTNGHLLVIGGFTASGDVISYDPAATSDDKVRRVYDRAQFEKAWMTATGGIVYVIHPSSVPLPPSPGNW